ncbi:MAG: geranylgeranylglyceryl/heptaprenylglyceryl phosphate synthase [Bacteroidetes bacterium]|nr:MAG: geranylgeranylglyceryl/heptaprenylglyceryl phosphate synthase [Bacteroidota bacterium]
MILLSSFKNFQKKKIAQLIDPDKLVESKLRLQIQAAEKAKVDYIFMGGSLISNNGIDLSMKIIKELTNIPVIIFPGNVTHLHDDADAVLFLSLISGRNPDLLIGNHIHVATTLKRKGIETIPTGYMLIESGKITSAQYMSNTLPIPHEKPDIAVATAVAGELLGLKAIYMDAGSGADKTISENMIQQVKSNIDIPLIIGGGIRTAETAVNIAKAGADIIVVGNAAEDNPELIIEISERIHNI